jgi:glycosyltransferase involved in cell wall biosynthesis
VIVVIKRVDDGTEDLVKSYRGTLDVKTVFQEEGHVTSALNLGLRAAKNDVVVFLDDDAIPSDDLLEKYAETYEHLNVGGVAGDVVSSRLCNGKVVALHEKEETPFMYPFSKIGFFLWDKPLPGAGGHFVYITKSGYVASLGNMAYWRKRRPISSFLGMGANMSVLRRAIEGFAFEESWILGTGWEQTLAWHIWKQGYDSIFNPSAKVFHITHGETLSRKLSSRKTALFQAESELLFYRLYGKEASLSVTHRLVAVTYRTALALKKKELHRVRGIIDGNIIGLKRFVLGKLGSSYDCLRDLEAI